MASKRTRAITACVGTAAFLLPLTAMLASVVTGVAEAPLIVASAGWEAVPVAIPRATYAGIDGPQNVHRLRLRTRDVGSLAAHSQIRLLVATHGTSPKLTAGDLALPGTTCVYRTLPGATFPNNSTLAFIRGRSCSPLQGTPTGELQLTLRFSVGGKPALWTFVPPAGTAVGDALIVDDPRAPESPARPVVRGTVADLYRANVARRVDLLAYMWQISSSALWLECALLLAGALLAAGLYIMVPGDDADRRAFPRAVAKDAFGAFCAAASLTLAYVVLVPPFQAADEPNHFAGFAAFIKRPGMDVEAAQWASLAHFERMQFHPEERFRPSDRGNPGIHWNDGGGLPNPTAARGPGIEFLWSAVDPFVRTLPAPRLLLALRLINAALFSGAIAVFVGLVAMFSGIRWPLLAAVPLFLVPTLPFFGMQVSNYAVLVSAYVILGAGVVIAFHDGPRSAMAGPVMAGGWMMAVLISRSAIPLAPFIGALLVARILLGSRDRTLRSACVFWLSFCACIMAGIALADRTYLRSITDVAVSRLPSRFAALFPTVIAHPWILLGLGTLAAGAESLVSRAARARPRWTHTWLQRATVGGAIAAAVLGTLLFAGPFVFRYPVLNLIDQMHPPEASAYARSAVLAGLTLFRFTQPDFLTSTSFWGGFGWLETRLPEPFVAALAAASGLAFIALLVWIAWTTSVRAAVWLACALAGYVLSLAAYAVSVIRVTPADLHGRYLLGLYLCVLLVSWSSVARATDAGWLHRPSLVIAVCALCCVAIHACALALILARYF